MCLFINATAALRLATETVWLAGLAGQRRQRRFFAAPSILFFVFFLSGFQTCHSSNRASYKCQMIIMRRRANKLQRIVGVVEKGNRRFFWIVNLFFLNMSLAVNSFLPEPNDKQLCHARRYINKKQGKGNTCSRKNFYFSIFHCSQSSKWGECTNQSYVVNNFRFFFPITFQRTAKTEQIRVEQRVRGECRE